MNPEQAQLQRSSARLALTGLLSECAAECLGTLLYVAFGTASTASLLLAGASSTADIGSLLNIAISYSFGIVLAIILTAQVSGAHLSPGVTLTFTLLRKFPAYKIVPYIISQLLGAIAATLSVYAIYGQQLNAIEASLLAAGKSHLIFSSSGPAGIGGTFVGANQHLGRVFFGEWFVGCMLGLIIFGALDKQNPLMNHHMIPFLIGMAYLIAIIAFAPNTIILNTARGLGGQIATSMIYGREVFQNKPFVALATLTNIPATMVGGLLYKLIYSHKHVEEPLVEKDIVNVRGDELSPSQSANHSDKVATVA